MGKLSLRVAARSGVAYGDAGIVARQDTRGAIVGPAKQANNVGETEETGDVNWIMMVQNLSVGIQHK